MKRSPFGAQGHFSASELHGDLIQGGCKSTLVELVDSGWATSNILHQDILVLCRW